jgi:hypothetical protein
VDPPYTPGAGEWGNVEPKWWGELPPGGSQTIKFAHTFTTATTYTLYAQTNADRYWSIPEVTYDNNTFGPFDVFVVKKGGIYLPLIMRFYTD